MELRERADTKLVTVANVNMNSVAETDLFTVPAGKSCFITHVIIHNASISLTTASFGFGYNVTEDDVIAPSTLGTGLTAVTKYRVLEVKDGAARGEETHVFKIGVDVAQGAAATMECDVFGYLF